MLGLMFVLFLIVYKGFLHKHLFWDIIIVTIFSKIFLEILQSPVRNIVFLGIFAVIISMNIMLIWRWLLLTTGTIISRICLKTS